MDLSHPKLGGGNSNIFYVHPDPWGFMIQVDEHIFQMGWFNHQLVSHFKDPYLPSKSNWMSQGFESGLVKYYNLTRSVDLSHPSKVGKNANASLVQEAASAV